MATIDDIATKAGVSKMTVSRVLNGASYQRPTFARRAERIRRIADQLGYRPNAYAKVVSTGRFNAITLLLSEDFTRSPLPPRMLYGIQAAAAEAGLTVNLHLVTDQQLDDEQFVPPSLKEWHSDGILINYQKSLHRRLPELIERYRVPAVWLNIDADHDCVRPDDFAAGRDATRRLLDLGHRRVWHVNYSLRKNTGHYSEIERRDGYIQAMTDAGLEPVMIDRYHPTLGDYYHSHDTWVSVLGRHDRPTAIVCYGSVGLSILQHVVPRVGLRVPDDLSLVTFGSASVFDALPIDTWVSPDDQVGRVAFEMLQQKIAHPDQALCRQTIPFTFAPGESVAGPPQNVSF